MLIAFLANVVLPLDRPEQFTIFGHTDKLWDTFARYDSGWYYGIARHGYQFTPGGRSNLAFFPVYPLLMRHLGRLLGGQTADYYFAGILISWVAFVMAVIMLWRLARLDLSSPGANRAVFYATIFPFAFFYGLVYSESVFLLCAVVTLYAVRTRRWMLGSAAGALLTATRVNGILAVPAVAWLAWRSAGADRRQQMRAALTVAATTGGFAAYCAYVYWMSGSLFEWAASIRRWGYEPGGAPWTAMARLLTALGTHPVTYLAETPGAVYELLNGGTAIACVASIPFVWARLGAGYGLFMLANLWVPLSSGQFEGLGRYCAVLFPWFIWLGSVRWRVASGVMAAAFAMFYGLCLALFTTLHPIF